MITHSPSTATIDDSSEQNWQQQLSNAIRDPKQLLKIVKLDNDTQLLSAASHAHQLFPTLVSHSFAARIQPGNPNDPLLKQVLPVVEESYTSIHYSADPVGDLDAMPVPGLLHKYQGRVLLITTAACPVHCRYCFRREFPYQTGNAKRNQWRTAIEYIQNDTTIEEVILSGGDPLALANSVLADLFAQLAKIPHLRRLRIHTRFPIIIPDRVEHDLIQLLAANPLQTILVTHINHPQEIDENVTSAIKKINEINMIVLNQAVLLKEINDSAATQVQLSKKLITIGIIPYYLHTLDRVQGTKHFEVDEKIAANIVNEMNRQLPGYMVPKLVTEIAGSSSKTLISIPA